MHTSAVREPFGGILGWISVGGRCALSAGLVQLGTAFDLCQATAEFVVEESEAL